MRHNGPRAEYALAKLANLEKERQTLAHRTTTTALTAYQAGASWAEIGAALGITRQAAQKRYDRRMF